MALISLSTLVAARIRSEEFAEGILNVLTWPMMLFSGVWFSLEGTNPMLKKVAQIFPMTHIVDGARADHDRRRGLRPARAAGTGARSNDDGVPGHWLLDVPVELKGTPVFSATRSNAKCVGLLF